VRVHSHGVMQVGWWYPAARSMEELYSQLRVQPVAACCVHLARYVLDLDLASTYSYSSQPCTVLPA
jgi:hypothetical protein